MLCRSPLLTALASEVQPPKELLLALLPACHTERAKHGGVDEEDKGGACALSLAIKHSRIDILLAVS